jgi:hypothetical protein
MLRMPLAGAAPRVVLSPSRLKVPDDARLAALPAAGAEGPLVPKIRMAGIGPNSSPAVWLECG